MARARARFRRALDGDRVPQHGAMTGGAALVSHAARGVATTGMPRDGAIVTARSTGRMRYPGASRRSTRGSTVASTIFISYVAIAAPRQRRTPPPNGKKV